MRRSAIARNDTGWRRSMAFNIADVKWYDIEYDYVSRRLRDEASPQANMSFIRRPATLSRPSSVPVLIGHAMCCLQTPRERRSVAPVFEQPSLSEPFAESAASGVAAVIPPGGLPMDALVALVRRISAGEQAALAELYDLTARKLYGLCGLIVRNAEDAEEVICDVYAQVWRTAHRYDSTRGPVLAWLLTICRTRSLYQRRSNSSRRRIAQEYSRDELRTACFDAGPQELWQALEQNAALHRALSKLSSDRRRIVLLAYFEGRSHEEIARETRLPMGTVKSHIRRALAVLRAELSGSETDRQSMQ